VEVQAKLQRLGVPERVLGMGWNMPLEDWGVCLLQASWGTLTKTHEDLYRRVHPSGLVALLESGVELRWERGGHGEEHLPWLSSARSGADVDSFVAALKGHGIDLVRHHYCRAARAGLVGPCGWRGANCGNGLRLGGATGCHCQVRAG
jgi:hypothetical protein